VAPALEDGDAGKTWVSIKQGIIEDSDVFSIICGPEAAERGVWSACSGFL